VNDAFLTLIKAARNPKHTCHPFCHFGRGSSAFLDGDIQVEVTRVENPRLWKTYVQRAESIREHNKIGKKKCPPLKPGVGWSLRPGDDARFSTDNIELDPVLDTTTNEVFLWHGIATPWKVIEAIAEHGFDHRQCSPDGNYGGGLYFAAESCKAAQYTNRHLDHRGTVDKVHYFIYSRVCLGMYYDAKEFLPGAKTAPLYTGGGRQTYESIISNPKYKTADADGFGHREFVVYDKNLTYPEFIVKVTCPDE
jgi:hypothetical protein